MLFARNGISHCLLLFTGQKSSMWYYNHKLASRHCNAQNVYQPFSLTLAVSELPECHGQTFQRFALAIKAIAKSRFI